MISVTPQPEPTEFHEGCRVKGQAWLAQHPDFKRPKDFWTPFEPSLHQVFRGFCGWSVAPLLRGQIDHFVSIAEAKRAGQTHLAYEWSNLRYCNDWINQKKGSAKVLDPFLVQPGWFQILLPSLQLVATDEIPTQLREIAGFTLKRLGLADGEAIVRFRSSCFQTYRKRRCDLDYLREIAPLVALAVEQDLQKDKDWRIEPAASSPETAG